MAEIEIRKLQPTDSTRDFVCGNDALDRFFNRLAKKQNAQFLGVTYVAVMAETILGFVTVAPTEVEPGDVPQLKIKCRFPLPGLRLARLAVHLDHQRKGIGLALTNWVFDLAQMQADTVGCKLVVVDAKPEAIDFYRRLGFAPFRPLAGDRIPHEITAMYLSIESIRAADSNSS